MDKFSLSGKTALVTGGSRGIGRAIALAFADAGADVAVSSRKLPDLEDTAKEIKAKGRKALAISSHVAKLEESKNLVEKVKAEFGKIDILVNNAGTNIYMGPIIDAEEGAWDVIMNVNLKGPFLLSQLVGKVMREQGGGTIVNISSTAGLRPSNLNLYSISKAGLIMMTQVLAREWGQYHIRVNAIAPGIVETKFSEPLWKSPDLEEKTRKASALGRRGVTEDIALGALYLASDASAFVTGVTLPMDGGALLSPGN